VFLLISGGGSMVVGFVLIALAPRLGLGGVRPRLTLAHLVVLIIAFANIVVTSWLTFISPHDLGLLGLLLAFSAVVAFAFAALVRVAARVRTQEEAEMVVHEVDSLGLNGPSGGSIAAQGVREVLGVVSTFVSRDLIRPTVTVQTVRL
jgi:hypothetical protein